MRELSIQELDAVYGGDVNVGTGNGNSVTITLNF
jgi:bacteriocin-like protein